MKLPHRRQFLRLASGFAAMPAFSRIAKAQTYPSRPVRIVVGFPPGQTADLGMRIVAQRLSERLGNPFVVDNRPGANGNIAAEAVAHASPDGYTLLSVNTGNFINASLYEKLSFNLIRDIAPVASVSRANLILVVHPSFPAKTVPDLIAYAKANPGKVNMASGGIGNSTHLGGELFKMMTGVEMVHVPYRGSAPAITDLVGGQVQVMFDVIASSIEHVRAGRLRALGITSMTRLETLPTVPAVSEFLQGYEVSTSSGIGVPTGTPSSIVNKLNQEINAGLADPNIKARFADSGVTVLASSATEYGQYMAEQTEKWGKVIRAANIKPE
jgi:tripartite-type tricarboxylate transporter receptor subunit TctC